MSELPPIQISNMLPPQARDRLIRAAAMSNELDPRARQKAIEIAVSVVRSQFPTYFRLKEINHDR